MSGLKSRSAFFWIQYVMQDGIIMLDNLLIVEQINKTPYPNIHDQAN